MITVFFNSKFCKNGVCLLISKIRVGNRVCHILQVTYLPIIHLEKFGLEITTEAGFDNCPNKKNSSLRRTKLCAIIGRCFIIPQLTPSLSHCETIPRSQLLWHCYRP